MAWEQSHLESKWALRRMMLPVTSKHLNPDTPVNVNVRLLSGQKKAVMLITASFIFTFLQGIQNFLRETVQKCVKNGYVKTLLGRKRFLPGIKDSNVYIKSHVSFHEHSIIIYLVCNKLNFDPPF